MYQLSPIPPPLLISVKLISFNGNFKNTYLYTRDNKTNSIFSVKRAVWSHMSKIICSTLIVIIYPMQCFPPFTYSLQRHASKPSEVLVELRVSFLLCNSPNFACRQTLQTMQFIVRDGSFISRFTKFNPGFEIL